MSRETYWLELFSERRALWLHDGNPKRPHALLTSKNHSDGFFNASKIINSPLLLEMSCIELLARLGLPKSFQGVVFGSAMGAVTIAYEMARQIQCKTGFTEPAEFNGKKVMKCKRFSVDKGVNVLVVEDVLTTGGTTRLTIDELQKHKGKVHKKIAVLVNRSGITKLDKYEVVALIDRPMPIWSPEECPLCKLGSEAIRPKDNWDLLTASY